MCISKVTLLAKEKNPKSKSKIRRKKPLVPTTPFPATQQDHEKLSRLKILREAFFEGHITKKELREGIEEIGL